MCLSVCSLALLQVRFYSDDAALTFVRREFPEYFEAYLNLPKDVERADFFRWVMRRVVWESTRPCRLSARGGELGTSASSCTPGAARLSRFGRTMVLSWALDAYWSGQWPASSTDHCTPTCPDIACVNWMHRVCTRAFTVLQVHGGAAAGRRVCRH